MPLINGVDTEEFGRRVERLCEYLLNKVELKDGSQDLRVIEDIKEDAANLQVETYDLSFSGLYDHMKGTPE